MASIDTITPLVGLQDEYWSCASFLLSRGKAALIDAEDYDRVAKYKWYYVLDEYGREIAMATGWDFKRKKPITYLLHRIIMEAARAAHVDHINHNCLDNRRVNLRVCTNAENSRNRRKGRRATSSRHKGVCFMNREKRWGAYIRVNYKKINLGTFRSEHDAARAYNAAAIHYHQGYSCLNIIAEDV